MGKLSLSMLCFGAALAIASSAYAKGSAVVFHMEADHAKFVPTAPLQRAVIIKWSPQHHHYHRIYLPQAMSHSN
jgi:hypothetical protein